MQFVARRLSDLSGASPFVLRQAQDEARPAVCTTVGLLTLSLSKGEDAPNDDTAHHIAAAAQRLRNVLATGSRPACNLSGPAIPIRSTGWRSCRNGCDGFRPLRRWAKGATPP
jgi:hypothetical protein